MHPLTHSKCVLRASRGLPVLAFAAVALFAGLVFDCTPAYAQSTYYVATSGSDGNPGTQSAPFKTIQHAADIVNPGDTVLVGDGTYTMTSNACGSAVVCLTRGGTSSAWVTFRSINPEGAKLSGQSNSVRYGFEFRTNANYIRIDGFEVFGMGYASGDASGFVLYNGGHDVIVSHNDIHDVGRLCTDTTNGETGIFIAMPNVTVDSNRIHDIGRFAPGENGCSPSTSYYTNHDHGIYVNGNDNGTMIRNNVFWNNKRGWSVQVYPNAISNLSILNNTFAYANPYSDGHIIIGANTTNARIVDNIFYQPKTAAIDFYSGSASGMVVANNISTNAMGTSSPSGVTFSNNQTGTDPQLDLTTYRPASTSPAIDRGQTLSDVTYDFAGVTRPQGAASDIGAYEQSASGTTTLPPAAPSSLAATAASSSAISLKWTDNATTETGFKIKRSLDGVTYSQVATTGAGVTSYGDSGLAAGTTYFYEVCAYNAGGDSAYSNTASATTAAAVVTAPAAPGALAASATSSGTISLSWADNSSNETGFKVERSLDGATFSPLATLASGAIGYSDSGLAAATKYYYRVYAYNSGGNSAYSNVASATTAASTIPPPPTGGGTTYYVAPTGSDSSAGTQSAPFRTIQHAADVVNPGDSVLVADGTYTMTAGNACGSAVVCLTRGGTSSAWVTFKSINPRGAKIDGQSNGVRYGFEFGSAANYIRIDGFEVFGMGYASGDASGFCIYSGGHDVVIANNDIHDIGRLCTDTTNGETGVFIEQQNVTVDGNTIHDIGRFAPGENGCSPSTSYYTNHDHGIYADGSGSTASGAMIRNNIFWNNKRGWAVQVYPGSVSNLSILNNTFAYANPYSPGHIIIAANTTNARIIDNIFYQPTTAGIDFYSGTATGMVVANNISTNAIGTSSPSGVSLSANLSNTDPQLDSTFKPASTSPAVDRGLTLADVTDDVVGCARPQGASSDIGAYEYAGGTTVQAPAAPGSLAATATSPTEISLTWIDNSANESGFKVERSLDGASFSQVATLGAGATGYSDSGLAATTKYYYRVSAYNSAGSSAYSNVASATTLSQTLPPPSDTTPPTVAITSPASGATVDHRVTITATASDNVGVAAVRFTIDGQTIATDTAAPYTTTYNFQKLSRGAHTVSATATDAAGNATTAAITVYR